MNELPKLLDQDNKRNANTPTVHTVVIKMTYISVQKLLYDLMNGTFCRLLYKWNWLLFSDIPMPVRPSDRSTEDGQTIVNVHSQHNGSPPSPSPDRTDHSRTHSTASVSQLADEHIQQSNRRERRSWWPQSSNSFSSRNDSPRYEINILHQTHCFLSVEILSDRHFSKHYYFQFDCCLPINKPMVGKSHQLYRLGFTYLVCDKITISSKYQGFL